MKTEQKDILIKLLNENILNGPTSDILTLLQYTDDFPTALKWVPTESMLKQATQFDELISKEEFEVTKVQIINKGSAYTFEDALLMKYFEKMIIDFKDWYSSVERDFFNLSNSPIRHTEAIRNVREQLAWRDSKTGKSKYELINGNSETQINILTYKIFESIGLLHKSTGDKARASFINKHLSKTNS